ncbi:hypothetical protein JTB14_005914 [Gonioctena quinquepunctata]|nr:hypothetical protein JTB14_005914 [Gonioctena quinquepunctata]
MHLSILLMVLIHNSAEPTKANGSEFLSSALSTRKQSNWLTFAGKTYYFDTVFKANFYRATQYCRQQGMHLLSISNQHENDRIGKFITDNGLTSGHFWTSASNLADPPHEWVWLSTGNHMIYTNWYPGEPNGNTNTTENCVEVRYWGSDGFTWNDLRCSAELLFICESTNDCDHTVSS